MRQVLRQDQMFCPLCQEVIHRSEYLHSIFKDNLYAEWFANLVTHYRHDHIKCWDRAWQSRAYREKIPIYRVQGYDAYKIIVNNRCKRQLMRGINKSKIDLAHKIGLVEACAYMQNNDPSTYELCTKILTRLRETLVVRHDPNHKPLDFELVYVGNDPKILGEIKQQRLSEFNEFEQKFKSAIPMGGD